jgi:diaminopimelate epimerase
MEFIKMHGAGNDYVYIDCFKEKVSNPAQLARRISHRRFGVGSDGLILIRPAQNADAEMEMYNADGSKAEMCGNGLRCVAKYVHDYYLPGKKQLNLLTGKGPLTAEVSDVKNGRANLVTIDMGEPVFEATQIPMLFLGSSVFNQTLEILGKKWTISAVSMGNPHCVIFVEDVEAFPVDQVGPAIENNPVFPNRVNVSFVQKISTTELIQRTWERGSGETWACGTGAAAVAVVGRHLEETESRIIIHLKGGDLLLKYKIGGPVLLTGPAVEVFRGFWHESFGI